MKIIIKTLYERVGRRRESLNILSNRHQRSEPFPVILICQWCSEQCDFALENILNWKITLNKFNIRKSVRKNWEQTQYFLATRGDSGTWKRQVDRCIQLSIKTSRKQGSVLGLPPSQDIGDKESRKRGKLHLHSDAGSRTTNCLLSVRMDSCSKPNCVPYTMSDFWKIWSWVKSGSPVKFNVGWGRTTEEQTYKKIVLCTVCCTFRSTWLLASLRSAGSSAQPSRHIQT